MYSYLLKLLLSLKILSLSDDCSGANVGEDGPAEGSEYILFEFLVSSIENCYMPLP